MNLNWAEITILVLMGIGLILGSNSHGLKRTGNHNFWISVIRYAILLFLLYKAGLFT